MLLAANVIEEHRIDKPDQPAIMGIHRDHWMKAQTASLAIVSHWEIKMPAFAGYLVHALRGLSLLIDCSLRNLR